jgi:hypothetical protein
MQNLFFGHPQQYQLLPSPASFSTAVFRVKETLNSTYHDAEVVPTSAQLRMYAWVADSKEAVFVIPAFAPKYVAYAFWTRDTSIIDSLLSNHQEHLEMNRRSKRQAAPQPNSSAV